MNSQYTRPNHHRQREVETKKD